MIPAGLAECTEQPGQRRLRPLGEKAEGGGSEQGAGLCFRKMALEQDRW